MRLLDGDRPPVAWGLWLTIPIVVLAFALRCRAWSELSSASQALQIEPALVALDESGVQRLRAVELSVSTEQPVVWDRMMAHPVGEALPWPSEFQTAFGNLATRFGSRELWSEARNGKGQAQRSELAELFLARWAVWQGPALTAVGLLLVAWLLGAGGSAQQPSWQRLWMVAVAGAWLPMGQLGQFDSGPLLFVLSTSAVGAWSWASRSATGDAGQVPEATLVALLAGGLAGVASALDLAGLLLPAAGLLHLTIQVCGSERAEDGEGSWAQDRLRFGVLALLAALFVHFGLDSNQPALPSEVQPWQLPNFVSSTLLLLLLGLLPAAWILRGSRWPWLWMSCVWLALWSLAVLIGPERRAWFALSGDFLRTSQWAAVGLPLVLLLCGSLPRKRPRIALACLFGLVAVQGYWSWQSTERDWPTVAMKVRELRALRDSTPASGAWNHGLARHDYAVEWEAGWRYRTAFHARRAVSSLNAGSVPGEDQPGAPSAGSIRRQPSFAPLPDTEQTSSK